MATLRLGYAEFAAPPTPRARLSYAELAVPEPRTMRLSYATLTAPSAGTARLRLSHASFTAPAAADSIPASGLWQLQADGSWRAIPVYQLIGGAWT
ncbi:hypothetical protein E1287_07560 [Actinomadura sp. KC06]|uniref:hypothetical protein n=1 Tax=Actinomadura sp. KC06 TaxID=2530369 RepID=UPI001049A42F|nr:hypothetical protein [Actinomadura sp. KC06]TDD37905.1 hypothetical protein E1287_07560 [Actinomadura sp. KC06]